MLTFCPSREYVAATQAWRRVEEAPHIALQPDTIMLHNPNECWVAHIQTCGTSRAGHLLV
jgi:hypothetical protein